VNPITISLPLRTRNTLNMQTGNSRLGGILRTRERRRIRSVTLQLVTPHLLHLRGIELPPLLVTLTRLSAGTMDDDGLASSLKAVRDGVAQAVGIDDGDRARLRFRYEQRKVPRGGFGVEVRIEEMANVES
jgi:hypothetical protein